MLKELDGKAFDPVVVKAAVELHEKGELALPTTPNPGVDDGRDLAPTLPQANRLRAVSISGRRLDDFASRFTIGGRSMRIFHSSARPPICENATRHSSHHGEMRSEIGSTIKTDVPRPTAAFSSSNSSSRSRSLQLVDDEGADDERGVGGKSGRRGEPIDGRRR